MTETNTAAQANFEIDVTGDMVFIWANNRQYGTNLQLAEDNRFLSKMHGEGPDSIPLPWGVLSEARNEFLVANRRKLGELIAEKKRINRQMSIIKDKLAQY